MAVNFDMESQLILAELHHFYNNYSAKTDPMTLYYSHLKLDLVYDQLIKENKLPDYPKEIKTLFWELSAKTTLLFNKASVMNRKSKDKELVDFANKRLKNERERFYKTYLTRKYLIDLLISKDKRVGVIDGDGNQISFLNIVGFKNE